MLFFLGRLMKFFSAIAKLIIIVTICALYLTNKKTAKMIDDNSFSIYRDENAYVTLIRDVNVYNKQYKEDKDELRGIEIKTLPANEQILIKKDKFKLGYHPYIIFYFEDNTPKLGYLLEKGNIGRKEYKVDTSPIWYTYRKNIYEANKQLFFDITNEFLEEQKDIVFASKDFSKQKKIKKQKNKILKSLIKPNINIENNSFYYVPLKSYFKYLRLKRKYQKKYDDLYKYELPQYTLLERIKGVK